MLELPYTVLDAEMTGLDPAYDELLALGAVRMVGPRIVLGETFYRLIRPEREHWGQSVVIHGIRPVDVAAAPPIHEVLPEFVRFCAGTILVGHGVEVDRRFLEGAASRLGLSWPKTLWIDTGRVARWLTTHHGALPEAGADRGRFCLEDLLAAYEIEPPARHHALADAYVTALVWQRQLTELFAEGIHTLRDLRLAGLA
ncbi:3'-5' exonuclease [Thermomicrobium sp. 4228-Ro]|uniref:3'-5' exonuclease n=1 Tax=Thermomicrobium sp. 4228-Ro TaxID=2993937 RepID=UPI002248C0B6|nr:3'-5' exonuclease [Thermomicrobium sp. 4228-Ro]MCX2727614.1 3'-5' exonuclease [Thermomicrobium sp. 4228-Ro]